METLEQIKTRILTSNPSRIAIINFEEVEITDAEFNDAVEKRAQMEYEQQLKTKEIADAKTAAEAKLAALGLTSDDLKALGLGGN
jgi:lipoate-protein ligase A